nr:uncharacterized protein LOC112805187 [Arachis hypogaea]
MDAEIQALVRCNTWDLVESLKHKTVIDSKWVFAVKRDPLGNIIRYKTRLVAKDFLQVEGIDYSQIYSRVVRPTTVRIVYMSPPADYQFGNALQFGFTRTKSNISLFVKHTNISTTFLLAYVDDIVVTGSDTSEIDKLISYLNKIFPLKDLGKFSYFSGLEFSYLTDGSILVSQQKYARDLLQKVKMDTANSMPTHMVSALKLTSNGVEHFQDLKLYREIVGSFQYLTISRPDLAFYVNKVSQYMHSPIIEHWKAVKCILRYIAVTVLAGIKFQKCADLRLLAFADADWTGNLEDRKLITGYCVYLGSNLVSWRSNKQAKVSRSSTGAEYRSMATSQSELVSIQYLLKELRIPQSIAPTIYCDNQSSYSLAANSVLHTRCKHLEIDLLLKRDGE